MYLLDTNVVSELRKLRNGKADPAFDAWFGGVALDVVQPLGRPEVACPSSLSNDPF
jgi:hypothetical protein